MRDNAYRISATILLAVALTGCATTDMATIEPPTRDQLISQDDQDCKSMGLKFGTPAYADCRLRVAQMRQQRVEAAAGIVARQQPVFVPAPTVAQPVVIQPPRQTSCNSMVAGNMISTNCY